MARPSAAWFRRIASLLFLLAVAAPVAAPPAALAADEKRRFDEREGEAYIVGPNNLIQVKIYGEAGITQIYRVDELGWIKHELVGKVQVAGKTVYEVEQAIETRLAGDYIINPQVTVFVLEYSHFSLLGEVRKPGTYEILGRVSIVEAISMAGGFTPVANQRGVKITRTAPSGEKVVLNVDVPRLTAQGPDDGSNVYIEADDVVVVPKSFF